MTEKSSKTQGLLQVQYRGQGRGRGDRSDRGHFRVPRGSQHRCERGGPRAHRGMSGPDHPGPLDRARRHGGVGRRCPRPARGRALTAISRTTTRSPGRLGARVSSRSSGRSTSMIAGSGSASSKPSPARRKECGPAREHGQSSSPRCPVFRTLAERLPFPGGRPPRRDAMLGGWIRGACGRPPEGWGGATRPPRNQGKGRASGCRGACQRRRRRLRGCARCEGAGCIWRCGRSATRSPS